MYHIAKLVLKSYMPKHLDKGMLFLTRVGKQMKVVELSEVPRDEDAYIQENGYPVEPYVIREGNPNLNELSILAQPEEVAWWDEGEHTDEYRDITVDEINFLIEYQDSHVEILINDEDFENGKILPTKYEGKIVLRVVNDYDEDHDDEDDDDGNYYFEGDELWDLKNDMYDED